MNKQEGLRLLKDQGIKALASKIAQTMPCNCDLDNWVPESDTGHSWVCRIHKRAKQFQHHPHDLNDGVDLAFAERGGR